MSDTRYRQSPHVVARTGEDEMILVHIHHGNVFRLNHTAQSIWLSLNTPRTLADIVRQLRQDMNVDTAVLERDVQTLLDELNRNELIRADPTRRDEGSCPADR